MKITLEHYSETITVETPEEITSDDFVDIVYRLGIMVGYQEENIADACAELGETYYAMNQSTCAAFDKQVIRAWQ